MRKIVNFIGAPCSGKSTAAVLLHYMLKSSGHLSEFVPEYARKYIAKTGKRSLTDKDQTIIMANQVEEEGLFSDTIVVSDSSPLNSLLYFDDVRKAMPGKLAPLLNEIEDRDVVYFYLKPLSTDQIKFTTDHNRLHSYKQSIEIDKTAISKIQSLVPNFAYIRLDMPLAERVEFAYKIIVNYFSGN